jgi:hypothetical protein
MDNEKEDMRYLYYGMRPGEVPHAKNKDENFRGLLTRFLPRLTHFFRRVDRRTVRRYSFMGIPYFAIGFRKYTRDVDNGTCGRRLSAGGDAH